MRCDAGGNFVAARAGLVVAVSRFGQGDAQAVMAQVARVGVRSPGEMQIAAVFVVGLDVFAVDGVDGRPRDVCFVIGRGVPVMHAVGIKADIGFAQGDAVVLRRAVTAPGGTGDKERGKGGADGAVVAVKQRDGDEQDGEDERAVEGFDAILVQRGADAGFAGVPMLL